tara:strand:- start:29087 stop:29536 length:450 start_codon:yes stop_codon:yes gene_type:complete
LIDKDAVSSVDAVKAIWNKEGLDGHLGLSVDHVADGIARVSMVLHREHLNLYGTGHGGALFSLADSAFALACNTRGYVTVASGCTIEFLRPAIVGDCLLAEAKWVDTNGKSSIYDVKIYNDKNEILAIFKGRSHQTSKLVTDFSSGDNK